MNDLRRPKIPVTILTGFLGSGKTTILNHIVTQPDMKSTAVIINEFGEIGIDHLLVETSEEQMVELNNGCICCTVRGDLADKLGSLAMWLDIGKVPPVERVIVETTGLADPAPILHTLMTDETLLARYALGGVVTVVDAVAGMSSLDRFTEASKQVAIADHLILSKGDLVGALSDEASYAALKARIRQINPRGAIHEAARGAIDIALFTAPIDETADTAFRDFSAWLRAAQESTEEAPCHDHDHTHTHARGAQGITSFTVEMSRPVDGDAFNDFLQDLAIEYGENLLRMKGILHVAGEPERPAVIHGVQHVFFPVSWLDRWPDDERTSKLVFITQDLEPQLIKSRFGEFAA
jgi:G3E family GTPase